LGGKKILKILTEKNSLSSSNSWSQFPELKI